MSEPDRHDPASMDKRLRLLLVEDVEDDALLLIRHLKQKGLNPVTARVETANALRAALQQFRWDAVLCDMSMPGLNALGALEEVKSLDIDIPFIVVSGTVPEEQLAELMKAGAHDVIVKERLSRLVGAIERAIEEAAVRHQRRHAESELQTSEEQFRSAFETAPHGMALVDLDGSWLKVNRAVTEMLGYEEEELLGVNFESVTHPDDLADDLGLVRQVLRGTIPTFQIEKRFIRKDGRFVWVLSSVALVRDGEGNPRYLIAQLIDISARKHAEDEQARLENELRHAQKMESLGTLSGGIAHEFNNMLLPIAGLLELSLDAVEDRPDVHENLSKALENARRAATLVDKILTFSRLDKAELARTDVTSAVDEAVMLLQATIPSTVSVFKELDDIGDAWIDRAQISQIVMNLGVNAMHAIGDGTGQIAFRLKVETVRRRRRTVCGQLPAGRYARLSVKDTGCGMDGGMIERIFEPFFTTKGIGKGTGMGLAFVHGVIKSHGGMIDVKSAPGKGTTFDVFIPIGQAAHAASRNAA